MKIITCYKCVPDEQDIAVNNADGSLDFSKADAKISQYDHAQYDPVISKELKIMLAHITHQELDGVDGDQRRR